MDQKQEELFWETLKIFNEIGLSAHVMLIGSWAEYFYEDMFKTDLDRKFEREILILCIEISAFLMRRFL